MPHLTFGRDGSQLFIHALRAGRTVIGRADSCDVALPAEGISRVHCILEPRNDQWMLLDRSKHGLLVNGEVAKRTVLEEGDVIQIGPFSARFSLDGVDWLRSPTATTPLPTGIHEEIIEIDADTLTAQRASLVATAGPADGKRFTLDRSRMSLGGEGSSLVIARDLPRAAAWVRVVRGRVMVEPGQVPVFLAGTRVRDVTPALEGEALTIGEHHFVVELDTSSRPAPTMEGFSEMVGTAPIMQRLFGLLHRMAGHDAPVLVIGESGTGKELAARGLHDVSPRADGPFIAINCAAIADNLFESELFGHEKGSFTGATNRQDGAFHHAHTGTLFLDEIGELKLDLQAKLLRVLESGEVKRVGSSKAEYPDVRLVAATNRNLTQMVQEGAFREDLYFRLSVLPVRTPSLREHRDDIPHLARTLLLRNHPAATLTEEAAQALAGYDWPGNVRELRNVLTRAVVLGGNRIDPSTLTFNPWAFDGARKSTPTTTGHGPNEKAALVAALEKTGNNRTAAARLLGMPRSSLLYKLRKHGLMD